MTKFELSVQVALLVAAGACNGSIVGGADPLGETLTSPADESEPFSVERVACGSQGPVKALPLRRLGKAQYINSLHDVLARSGLNDAEQRAAWALVSDDVAQLPDEVAEAHVFSNFDQSIQQFFVTASYDIGTKLGRAMTDTATKRGHLLGACATDSSTSNDAHCLANFVRTFGALALRRPLTAEQVTRYTKRAGTEPVAAVSLAEVVALLLVSPQFLYNVEEGMPGEAGGSPLDAYALASRLSYHFWQTMPDEALMAAADSGALLTDSVFAQQAERLLADPRADVSLERFFGEWMELGLTPPMNELVGSALFDAFAGADVPTATLHLEMNDEVLSLTKYAVRHDETVGSLLSNRKNFAKSEALAKLYRQPAWDGVSTPVELVEPARTGLLTRAAFTATGSTSTRPIMKGVRVRRGLLCQNLAPPPPDVDTTLPSISDTATTREQIEAITEQKGTVCAGCHKTMLNPLGFMTENFDALGRFRTHQRLFSATGKEVGQRAVDTHTTPYVGGYQGEVEDSAKVVQLLIDGGEFQTCFVRQYFRYTFQRYENDEQDGCLLGSLQERALAGASVHELLLAATTSAAFKKRVLP